MGEIQTTKEFQKEALEALEQQKNKIEERKAKGYIPKIIKKIKNNRVTVYTKWVPKSK